MALLALLHPNKTFDESLFIESLSDTVEAHDSVTPEEAATLHVTAPSEPVDRTFDGALFLWAYFRDVHLMRGSIVEMMHPARDIDPVDVKRKGKKK